MKLLRLAPVLALGLIGLATPASAAVTSHGHHFAPSYDCSSGNVPPGTYGWLTISGVCTATTGTIVVRHDLVVQPGALLDDITPGDGPLNTLPSSLATYLATPPAGTPLISATVDVGGNVFVGKGAALLLGCSPNATCAGGITEGSIGGSLVADGALGVVVHSTQIGGNVSIRGGGDGQTGMAACTASPAPWSEDPTIAAAFLPPYTDLEDSVIGGSVNVSNQTSCWLGVLRNLIGGNLWISNNVMGDPDSNEVGNNLVHGNMGCWANVTGTPAPPTPQSPGIQYGDGAAGPSIVFGHAFAQCGFDVTALNPAAEAGPGGVAEHLTVSAWRLHRYHGTHTDATPYAQVALATTSTGDVLTGQLGDATLSGWGLTGSIALDSSTTYDGSGELVLGTQHPDGWSSFQADDLCACSFQGQTGTVSIRAYGTTSPDGRTWGIFVLNSGGAQGGGLGTIAGWGTFTSRGQAQGSLALTEYLAIT